MQLQVMTTVSVGEEFALGYDRKNATSTSYR